MRSHDAHDPMLQNLLRLRPLAPDPARAERVRARCRAQLGRSRRRSERVALIAGFARHFLAPVIVGGLCALYIAALVGIALRLHSVLLAVRSP